jgi:hypothetical protein
MLDKLFPPYSGQTKLIALATLCVVFFLAGWTVHGWKKDAGLTRSITKDEKTRQSIDANQGKIIENAQKVEAQSKIIYRTIRERINDKNDNRVCFADAESLQLWNRAIAGADQHRSGSTAAPEQTSATQPGNQTAIATVEQVLINASENFQICNENAIRHNALIDSLESFKGKMCVCGY